MKIRYSIKDFQEKFLRMKELLKENKGKYKNYDSCFIFTPEELRQLFRFNILLNPGGYIVGPEFLEDIIKSYPDSNFVVGFRIYLQKDIVEWYTFDCEADMLRDTEFWINPIKFNDL